MYRFYLVDSQTKEVLWNLASFLTLLWKYKLIKLDLAEILNIIKMNAGE